MGEEGGKEGCGGNERGGSGKVGGEMVEMQEMFGVILLGILAYNDCVKLDFCIFQKATKNTGNLYYRIHLSNPSKIFTQTPFRSSPQAYHTSPVFNASTIVEV